MADKLQIQTLAFRLHFLEMTLNLFSQGTSILKIIKIICSFTSLYFLFVKTYYCKILLLKILIKIFQQTSGQDGGIGRNTVPPRTTKRRTTTNLKKQPELPENQTAWKSDNQGVKEETIIQTSRRGGDRQPGWRGLAARQQLDDQGGQGGGSRTR